MKMGLRLKSSLIYASIIIITVAVIYFGAGYMLRTSFGDYLVKRISAERSSVLSSIKDAYTDEGWDAAILSGLIGKAANAGMGMVIYDLSVKMVASSSGQGMMGRMMRGRGMSGMWNKPRTVSETYDIQKGGALIGSAFVTYQNIFLTDYDEEFLQKFYTFLLVSGAVMAAVAVVLGIVFADTVIGPILKVLGMAGELKKGNYSMRVSGKVDTKEIRQLYEGMNVLAEEMGGQEALRRRMAGDIAHELKTPVTIAMAHLEGMEDGILPLSKENISVSIAEMQRLSELAGKLEQVARLEGKLDVLDMKHALLHEICAEAVDAVRPLFSTKGMKVGCAVTGSPKTLALDKASMRQALDNILMNAFKYAPEGGEVSARTSYIDEFAEITIVDDGPGIAEKDLPFIFERFYRTDRSRSRGSGGMGIGLALAKSIVEAHGGSIRAESSFNDGTKFVIRIPYGVE